MVTWTFLSHTLSCATSRQLNAKKIHGTLKTLKSERRLMSTLNGTTTTSDLVLVASSSELIWLLLQENLLRRKQSKNRGIWFTKAWVLLSDTGWYKLRSQVLCLGQNQLLRTWVWHVNWLRYRWLISTWTSTLSWSNGWLECMPFLKWSRSTKIWDCWRNLHSKQNYD